MSTHGNYWSQSGRRCLLLSAVWLTNGDHFCLCIAVTTEFPSPGADIPGPHHDLHVAALAFELQQNSESPPRLGYSQLHLQRRRKWNINSGAGS